ncbi:MAG TPA: hypothetical protein ENG48_12005 [Candidatus Atribacteria bacterium]|nr:hypothetical protein [Candidatus Atribacteria bacterium]
MGNDFRTKVQQIIDQITDILEKRNEKYGDLNLMESGLLGIIIRIKDKIARIKKAILEYEKVYNELNEASSVDDRTAFFDREEEINNVIRDALIDIAGYAINSLRLLDDMPTGLEDFESLWEEISKKREVNI